jgi:hypothetical protein
VLPPPPVRPPPANPLADAHSFFACVQSERHAGGLVTERPPHPAKLDAWWSEAMMELGGDASRIRDAITVYAKNPYWKAQQPQSPFRGFMAQWRDFAPRKTT